MARIDQFRAVLAGGGARPSQFVVSLTFPTWVAAGTAGQAGQFLVKATTLPASTITPIDVPFRGRIAKIAGERMFSNWQVTVLNDNDFLIRDALERWSAGILNHSRTNGIVAPTEYTADMFVTQLDRNDNALKTYRFFNCYPQNISEIGLDFGNTNQVEEFGVEFSVDYWTAETTDQSV